MRLTTTERLEIAKVVLFIWLIASIDGNSNVAFNRPPLDPCAEWDQIGMTFAALGAIGFPFVDIFVDVNDTVYFTDTWNDRIQVWLTNGTNATRVLFSGLSTPRSVFVIANGDIFVDNGRLNQAVVRWAPNATTSVSAMSVSASCWELFIDLNDTLYCSLRENHIVVKAALASVNGTKASVAVGSVTSGSTASQLNKPQGIFVDEHFNLYVADSGNNRIQKFLPGSTLGSVINATTVAGVQLQMPTDVVLDADGYLFIVDSKGTRIIGSGPLGFRCILGCPSASGVSYYQFAKPQRLSFDSHGNIFVTDEDNLEIRKFALTSNSCATAIETGSSLPTITTTIAATATTIITTVTVTPTVTTTAATVTTIITTATVTPTVAIVTTTALTVTTIITTISVTATTTALHAEEATSIELTSSPIMLAADETSTDGMASTLFDTITSRETSVVEEKTSKSITTGASLLFDMTTEERQWSTEGSSDDEQTISTKTTLSEATSTKQFIDSFPSSVMTMTGDKTSADTLQSTSIDGTPSVEPTASVAIRTDAIEDSTETITPNTINAISVQSTAMADGTAFETNSIDETITSAGSSSPSTMETQTYTGPTHSTENDQPPVVESTSIAKILTSTDSILSSMANTETDSGSSARTVDDAAATLTSDMMTRSDSISSVTTDQTTLKSTDSTHDDYITSVETTAREETASGSVTDTTNSSSPATTTDVTSTKPIPSTSSGNETTMETSSLANMNSQNSTISSITEATTTLTITTIVATMTLTTAKMTTFIATTEITTPTSTAVTTATPGITPTSIAVTTATPDITPTSTAVPIATPGITPTSTAVTTATPGITPTSIAVTTATPDITPTSTAVPIATPGITSTSTAVTTATPDITPTSTAVTTATPDITATSTAVTTVTIVTTLTSTAETTARIITTLIPTTVTTATIVTTATSTTVTTVATSTSTAITTTTQVTTATPVTTTTATIVTIATSTAVTTSTPITTPASTAVTTATPVTTTTATIVTIATSTAVTTSTPITTPASTAVTTATIATTLTPTTVPTATTVTSPITTTVTTVRTITSTAVTIATHTTVTARATTVPTVTTVNTVARTPSRTVTATNQIISTLVDSTQSVHTTSIQASPISQLTAITTTTSVARFIPPPCNSSALIGFLCNISSAPCQALKPCDNAGTCVDNSTSNSIYQCHCPPGFNGTRCELDIPRCQADTCWFNGICTNQSGGGFACACTAGRWGTRCERMVNHCENVTCANKGVCRPLLGDYKCECVSGSYSGRHCEIISSGLVARMVVCKSIGFVALLCLLAVVIIIVAFDVLKYVFHIDPVAGQRERIRRKKGCKKRKKPRAAVRFEYINKVTQRPKILETIVEDV